MADLNIEAIERTAAEQSTLTAIQILLDTITDYQDLDSVGLNDCETSITFGQIKQGIQGFIHFSTCRLGDLEDGIE